VILEAMAAGTPWLSTNVGNVAELGGGWVADAKQMALKADTLLDSRTLRSHLGRQGKQQWKAKYTWQHIVDQYERLYLEISALPKLPAIRQEVVHPAKAEPSSPRSGLVSVVIPCYKQAHFLADAVASVVGQTYRSFEIVIVDDGSPDDTKQTAQMLIARYPDQSIRLISHSNQGLASSRNAGIREGRGEYIVPLDADDKLRPGFLQACMDRLSEDPSASIIAVDLEEFGESDRRIACGIPDLEHLAVENQINYCSLFRKSLWAKVGGYRSNMQWGFEDWDFWISCLADGARVSMVRDCLFLYRRRGESMYTAALEHNAELQAQIVLNHPGLYEKGTEDWAKAHQRLACKADGTTDVDAHRVLAQYYVSRMRWDEALPHLTRLIEAPDVSSELAFLFGAATLKMKEFRRAYKALRRFLDVRPDHAAAQFLASLASACLGDLRAAREHAEDAIELDLKMTAGYELLIAISRAEQDFETAHDLAQRCSQLQIQISPWAFSQRSIAKQDSDAWMSFLYSKYLEFSPLPLLVLNQDRLSNPAPIACGSRVDVEAEVKVSVIMPTCNRPEMLIAAIDSVRKQTMQNFEILVVNDAGSDVEAVVSPRNRSRKITYVRHGQNRGLAAARNTGIKLARGQYIAYLDDDDLYYPDHLQTLVHCLEKHDCAVAYTDANRAHQVRQDEKLVVTHRDLPFSVDFNHDRILVGNFIPVLCVMHSRKCLDDVGLFDESLTTHEDWDLWIRLSRKYRFAHVRKTTCEFSWRTDGTSMTSQKQQDFLRTIEIIYGKTGVLAKGKPAVVEARSQYLQEKKRLILEMSSPDNSEGRASVSAF
jgi:glycosyltransferase involved in cell wall biosynthesis